MSAFEPEPLLELFDDDRAEVGALLSGALRSVAEDLARATASLAERDARELGARAHRVKGTSASIGARALCDAASLLESDARELAWPAAASRLDALRAAARDLARDVAAFHARSDRARDTA